jgi:hypothetical protein
MKCVDVSASDLHAELAMGPTQPSIKRVPGGSFPWLKRSKREADH